MYIVVCRLAHILYKLIEFQVLVYSHAQYLRMGQPGLQHSRRSAAVLLLLIAVLCIGAPPQISLGWWLVHSAWVNHMWTATRLIRRLTQSNVQLCVVCIVHTDCAVYIEFLSDLDNWGNACDKEQWCEHTSLWQSIYLFIYWPIHTFIKTYKTQ